VNAADVVSLLASIGAHAGKPRSLAYSIAVASTRDDLHDGRTWHAPVRVVRDSRITVGEVDAEPALRASSGSSLSA
jgi:hypothetical protein